MQTAAFILSGLAAGILSGALGIGGAIVATPLIRFAGLPPYLAIGSTVPAILPGAITGAWTYLREGFVDTRAALIAGAAGSVFAFAGARATRALDGHLLMLFTAAVLFLLAVRLPKRQKGDAPALETDRSSGEQPASRNASAGMLCVLGAVAGTFSGLLGIGGGFVVVPVLVRAFSFPIKRALGTSLAVIALMAAPNIVGQSQAGNVDWKVALLLAVGTVPGARIGAALAIKSSDRALRIVVATGLALIALVYAALELSALS